MFTDPQDLPGNYSSKHRVAGWAIEQIIWGRACSCGKHARKPLQPQSMLAGKKGSSLSCAVRQLDKRPYGGEHVQSQLGKLTYWGEDLLRQLGKRAYFGDHVQSQLGKLTYGDGS